ncbi:uncharacterized protein LOC135167843 isoform X1 [Diachasmimorpha longicaudata]|uniref:uncharacterized protein LOC135167843 isoform X1 n=1 Tax=Diachasmimorpha longicaudata TaxID=58733 RepID=UPI0030B87DE0
MDDGVEELKIPRTKIFLVLLSLVLKLYCHLSGILSQQGELAIMNLLGVINSMRDWLSFNWQYQVEEISNLPLSHANSNANYEECVKTVLKWVVMTRMIIAHLYTATYIANFYPILTFCRGKLLVPWLAMSAVKNFILEIIVLMVVVLLYLQNHLSVYLLCEFFIHKLVTLAPAVYNWLTINSFYTELNMRNRQKLAILNTSLFYRKSSIVYKLPNVIIGLPMQTIKLNYRQEFFNSGSVPPNRSTSLTNYHHPLSDFPRNIRPTKSLSWASINRGEIDSLITQNVQSHARNLQEAISESSASSVCGCSLRDDQKFLDLNNKASEETVFTDEHTETIDLPESSFLPQEQFLKKMNGRFKLSDYTNVLSQYNDVESSRWSSDEELNENESSTTIIKPLSLQVPKVVKPSTQINSIQWRKRLEIIGSSFESTLQYYNHAYDSQSSKISANDFELSRSWILDGMIITGTVNNKTITNKDLNLNGKRLEKVEIEALKAYNKKTLWADRLKHQELKGGREKLRKDSTESEKRKEDETGVQRDIVNCSDSWRILTIKNAIADLDWSLKTYPIDFSDPYELDVEQIIDRNDDQPLVANFASDNTNNAMELLLFAFGFSDRSGFYAWNTARDIYSSSDIPNVFSEIIKTARVRIIKHDCNCRSTADVDYGENYWRSVQYII